MNTIPEINMGVPENKLKILSPDLQYLRPKKFFKYSSFNKTDIAKQAKINRKALYNEQVKLSTLRNIKKGILQVVIGTDLSIAVFNNNVEEAVNWFSTPNTLLFGESPFEVCIRGEGNVLIDWLNARLGKNGAIDS